ncbi:MAG: DUF3598 family protein [Steroidobacteraceae bacterium]
MIAASEASVFERMPVLVQHAGEWHGRYSFVTPAGEVQSSYRFQILVSFSRDNARAYRQESQYLHDDGRRESRIFEGRHRDGVIHFDTGRIAGRMWEIDETTVYLRFAFAADPEVECFEMIQLAAGGADRGRTWLWYRRGRLQQYTLIDEARGLADWWRAERSR